METEDIRVTLGFMTAVNAANLMGCQWDAYADSDDGYGYVALGFGNGHAEGEMRIYHPRCVRIGARFATGEDFAMEYLTPDAGCLALTLMLSGRHGDAARIPNDWESPPGADLSGTIRMEIIRLVAEANRAVRPAMATPS